MLYFVVFISGAVLMSLEMVGSRILAPAFGSSIYTWGSLIVVVMAALTLGYYCGGRLADRYPDFLTMGVILASAGIFIGLLPFWTKTVNGICSQLEPRTGSLLAALAFFFLPSLLLATISPYAIKLTSRSLTNIGNTAGHLSALSSAGSIIGTLITSFFLIPIIGVKNITHTLGLILLGLALMIFYWVHRRQVQEAAAIDNQLPQSVKRMIFYTWVGIFLLSIGWKFIPLPSVYDQNTKVLYDQDSLYHHIIIAEDGLTRRLLFDNSFQSALDIQNPLQMVFEYTSYLHLGVVAHPRPERVLFIGLGGGMAPYKFLHDYASIKKIDAVEIDPEVIKVARRYFHLPDDPRLRVFAQDGRLFVEKRAREITEARETPYDLVVIDAYSSSTIPYHLTTREFLEMVRRILSPDGIVASNIIGATAGSKSRLLYSMTRTFRAVFPQTHLFPVRDGLGADELIERNVVLIAMTNNKYWDQNVWQKQAEEQFRQNVINEDVPSYVESLVEDQVLRQRSWYKNAPLLTDDYAPVDTLKHPLL